MPVMAFLAFVVAVVVAVNVVVVVCVFVEPGPVRAERRPCRGRLAPAALPPTATTTTVVEAAVG